MSALRFTALTIRRMPGIDDGGFELKDLAPGVNVVYGPNAAGKTTTARALEALLWPERARGSSSWVRGSFDLGEARWTVELDSGRHRIQRNGEPATSPHALPLEASSRYRLELKELLESQDLGLARAIGLESAGGYDLAEAAKALSPRRSPSRPKREVEELKTARARLRDALEVQDRLQQELSTLRADEGRVAAKPAMEARLAYLRLAAEHAARREAAAEARARVGSYHPVLELLVGDESGRCAELQARFADAREAARVAREGVGRKLEEIDRLGMPPGLLSADHLPRLAGLLAGLERIEAEIRAEERACDDALATLEAESERVERLAGAGLPRVKLSEVTALVATVKEVEDSRARRRALEEELAILSAVPAGGDRARLERGAFLLQQWLRVPGEGTSGRRTRSIAIAASLALVTGGVGLALVHPLALLLTLAGAILLGVLLGRPDRADPRPVHQASFAEAGVAPSPRAWRHDEVQACLDELLDQLVAARFAEEAGRRRERLEPLLVAARRSEEGLVATLADAAAGLGLSGIADGALPWVLDRLSRLQDASTAVESATAGRARGLAQLAEVLASANRILVEAGVDPVADPSALRGALLRFDEVARAHARAVTELERCRGDLAAAERRQEELSGELKSLFARLSIDEADAPRLAEWCAERDAFLAARREADTLEGERDRLHRRLRLAHDFEEEILGRTAEEIDAEAARLAAAVEDLHQVELGVVELRSEVARATRGHDIEDALAEVERCEAALRSVRDRDARAAIAAVLVDFVERKSRNEQRPEVFHRASALLTRITRGRYELVLDETAEPSFRALDTQRDLSQSLDELSSATRLQLLLAVRVAFVELHEGGIQLPLLLDETLANSDDERASAIMEAVIALAAGGRQIFYFTAQPDEVRKWRDALGAADAAPGALFDLAEARRLGRRLDPALLEAERQPRPSIPPPGGLSHGDYGRILGVPRVDPLEPVGALHLWYLLEDPVELHRVMTVSGCDRWGNLRALLSGGGNRLLPEGALRRAEALADCAASALVRLRIGRGRPVDRHALTSSGAVTHRFLDEVADLAAALEGDGARLLDALGRRAVPNFLQRNVQLLGEFLTQDGYLDSRAPAPPNVVRFEVLAESARAIEARVVTIDEIDRLLARLRAGAAPLPRPSLNGPITDGSSS